MMWFQWLLKNCAATREKEEQKRSEIRKQAWLLKKCAATRETEKQKRSATEKLTNLLKNCAAAWETGEQKQSEIRKLLWLLKKCAIIKEENAKRQRELSLLAALLRNCAAVKEEEEQRQFAIGRLTGLLRRIAVLDSVAESDGGHGMKLHESLRKIIRQFGINVLQEKRLMSLLADYKSFDDYPAMKDVMRAVADEGHGKELCRLAMDGSDADYHRYADDVRKSLVRNGHFKESLATDESNKRTPKFKRMRLGEKGIGRFAAQRLGEQLIIVTQTENSEQAIKATINWADYVMDSEINEVVGRIEYVEKERTRGTHMT